MATKNLESLRLKLILDGGTVNGKPVKVNKTYNQIKKTATDDNLLGAAGEIAGLQNKPVINVVRLEESTLSE